MKKGPAIPTWAIAGAVALTVIVLAVVVGGMLRGDGARDPKTYPKEAYQNPYANSSVAQGPQGDRRKTP